MEMRVGPVERVVLFGGGPIFARMVKEAKDLGMDPHVFAVKRHMDEEVENGVTLSEFLDREGVYSKLESDINSAADLKDVVTPGTIGIGVGEAYTFSKETLDLFGGKVFDFMTIRLPKYRGGAHFTWQILMRNRIGSWNIQIVNEEMVPGVFDSGEILTSREFIIPAEARIPQHFFDVYEDEALKLFHDFLIEVKDGKNYTLSSVQEQFAEYYPRLHTMHHGLIDWSWSGDEIERFISAFDEPYPGSSTYLDGRRLFLKGAQADPTEGSFHPFMAGMIYRIYGGKVFVAAKDGGIIVSTVKDENGNDFIPNLRVGMRLFTPAAELEKAMLYNAEYDASGLVEKEKK